MNGIEGLPAEGNMIDALFHLDGAAELPLDKTYQGRHVGNREKHVGNGLGLAAQSHRAPWPRSVQGQGSLCCIALRQREQ